MDPLAPRIGVFLHCQYRVYREGGDSVAPDRLTQEGGWQDAAPKYQASQYPAPQYHARCDPLDISATDGTTEDALLKLAKALNVAVRIAIAQGKLDEVIRKLTAAVPERPVVSSSTTRPTEVLIDWERKEILIPVA
jgi:hypothetical protein